MRGSGAVVCSWSLLIQRAQRARHQAVTPLIPLSKFPGPPLTEAVRAGFKAAYEAQDYKAIVSVAAKLPENVLQEDEKLLMYFDVASMRLGEE